VTDDLLGGNAALVGSFSARFAGVVFPGETIRVQAWETASDEGGEQVVVSASIASHREERDGAPVLADCVLTRA
jgi:acyl dehydratase